MLARRSFRLSPPLLITMILWGFNFVALNLILKHMTGGPASLVRALLIYGSLVLICVVRKIPLRYRREDALLVLLQGFLAMGIYMVFFFRGMESSTPGEGAILLATSPIFTFLIAVAVRQEKFRPLTLLGILSAFGGVTLVILSRSHASSSDATEHARLIGNLCLLASAFIWAGSVVLTKTLTAKYEPFQLLTLSMPGGIFALLFYGGPGLLRLDWHSVSPLTWGMLAYMAIAAGALGFALFYAGVGQIGSSRAMVYQYLVAPIAALTDYLINGTRLTWLQALGFAVVIGGVAATTYARQAPVSSKAETLRTGEVELSYADNA